MNFADQCGNVTTTGLPISPTGQNARQFSTFSGIVFCVPTTTPLTDTKQVSVEMAPIG